VGQIRHKDRLLGLPDGARGRILERLFMTTDKIGWHVGLDGLQAHPIFCRIIQ
jgi:hypothetical protein